MMNLKSDQLEILLSVQSSVRSTNHDHLSFIFRNPYNPRRQNHCGSPGFQSVDVNCIMTRVRETEMRFDD